MYQPITNERGSTLIELILMIVIGVVAMFPLLAMYSNATTMSVEPELVSQAGFLAQEMMERVVADYHEFNRGYEYIVDANYPTENNQPGFPGFSIAVSVDTDSTYSSVQFKTVTVTASHSGIDDITLTSWVTQ
jgi:Tfp pilus assembly protein PilE